MTLGRGPYSLLGWVISIANFPPVREHSRMNPNVGFSFSTFYYEISQTYNKIKGIVQ